MRSRLLFSLLTACLWAAVLPARAGETVIQDSPSRLVIEVEVSGYQVEGGQRIVADGFFGPSAVGAPDLPQYHFQVASGAAAPRVSIEPLAWTELSVPAGLAGVPRYTTPTQSVPAKDPVLFAAAQELVSAVSDPQRYRGLTLRTVSVSLGTVSGNSARMLRKFRVQVDFSDAATVPHAGVRAWLLQAHAMNPAGGQYLTAFPRARALRKSSVAAAFAGGTPLLKIQVGDNALDAFDEDGVYALTYEKARAAGLPVGVQTGFLRVYAGPKDTLTSRLDSLVPPTLAEIPVQVADANANGTFDAGDTILFYAHGTSLWKPIPGATGAVRWEFRNDPYSFFNFYYLDWSNAAPGALRLAADSSDPVADTVSAAPQYLRAEKDLNTGSCDPSGQFDNETGYAWFWYSRFGCQPGQGGGTTLAGSQLRGAAGTLTGRVTDTAWFGMFGYAGFSYDDYNVWSGGGEAGYDGTQGVRGAWYLKTTGFNGEALDLDSVGWSASSDNRFEGYTVRYTRSTDWNGKSRVIFPAVPDQRVSYRVSSAPAGLRCLRVESGVGRKWLALRDTPQGKVFTDSAGADEDVEYFLYQAPIAPAAQAVTAEAVPSAPGILENLETGDNADPEYLILAPQALLAAALELRAYRSGAARQLALRTAVVRTEDIYRDWSGGRLSPQALRDFLRWAVNRWGGGGTGSLKYVLLYGDGHYDYRDLRNGASANPLPNRIPPFNWQYSTGSAALDPMNADDFYAVLDSADSWDNDAAQLALSLGRLPVQTPDQGRDYLDKVKRYEDPATAGEWRGRALLTADDATQRRNVGGVDPICCHTNQSEDLGAAIAQKDPGIRFQKVYLFDYTPNSSFLKPEATQDAINVYNQGVLYSNFFGHGAYNQLADEVLMKTNDGLSRIHNPGMNFFMSIFSCTVGRFDKLADDGMSEQFVRQKDYIAVGALSAARESYPEENEHLGTRFVSGLFSSVSDSIPHPVGEWLQAAKNGILSQGGEFRNKQKYSLLGEPVLIVARPSLGLRIDSIPDTLQALGCGTLHGRVTKGSGRGKVSVRILSGDVVKSYPRGNSALKPGQILFESTMDYTDSAFTMNYFLPKQIPFGDSGAKVQVFAWDAEQPLESSALIANRRLLGTGSCVVDSDGKGPRIAVTGCNLKESADADFPAQVQLALPYCLQIEVTDSVGGVMAGDGPDEGTTVEVVGAVSPYHPQAGLDDLYRKTFQLTLSPQDVPPGTHLLKVSARDGFGNLSQRQITLQVAQDTALRFLKAFNIPNPMKRGSTTFYFATSLPSDAGGDLTSARVDRVRFDLRIFNQQGLMVREFRDAVSGETQFDGRDAWGQTLANGVYFYQVTATWDEDQGSPAGGRKVSKKNVLVISR